MAFTQDDINRLAAGSRRVVGPDGQKIGELREFYTSDDTGEPTWVTVNTGLFGTHESFVPLAGARSDGDDLQVAFDKSVVKDAPRVETDGHLERDQEDELFRYYQSGSADTPRSDDLDRDRGRDRDSGLRDRDRDDSGMAAAGVGGGLATAAARRSDDQDDRLADREIGEDRGDRVSTDRDERRDDADDAGAHPRSTELGSAGRDRSPESTSSDDDPAVVTPGETTRLRRYVVTERVVQTVEPVSDDDDR